MKGFSLSVGREGAPLHFAAHSHHPWPDVTFAAQETAWRDGARLLDHKWEYIFRCIIPQAQQHIARELNLPDAKTIAFGPNTHSFVLRLLSCFPANKRLRIFTTQSEFHSFSRQIARWEEEGLAEVQRIPTEPFASFETRFADATRTGVYDLIFFSQVFFDSGFRVRDLNRLVGAVTCAETIVVVDGYHGFMAVPTNLDRIAGRTFYLAGGYKYAMAGEGVCFLHCPPGYGLRPRDTGWYAGFSALESADEEVSYPTNGNRFLGATFDVTGIYRFNAVQDWLMERGSSVSGMLSYVRDLERLFLTLLERANATLRACDRLVEDDAMRGRFLAFRTTNAEKITATLAAQNIIVDYRGDRLRIGFGIYHTEKDVLRLAEAITDSHH